jgi:hypothetical protein
MELSLIMEPAFIMQNEEERILQVFLNSEKNW